MSAAQNRCGELLVTEQRAVLDARARALESEETPSNQPPGPLLLLLQQLIWRAAQEETNAFEPETCEREG